MGALLSFCQLKCFIFDGCSCAPRRFSTATRNKMDRVRRTGENVHNKWSKCGVLHTFYMGLASKTLLSIQQEPKCLGRITAPGIEFNVNSAVRCALFSRGRAEIDDCTYMSARARVQCRLMSYRLFVLFCYCTAL